MMFAYNNHMRGMTMTDKKSGNFADDPKRASEAGKKGGEHSHGGPHQTDQIGHKDVDHKGAEHKGSGNFADNPERASEAGKKGGQHSH
jgi:general stress protein YciG